MLFVGLKNTVVAQRAYRQTGDRADSQTGARTLRPPGSLMGSLTLHIKVEERDSHGFETREHPYLPMSRGR